MTRAAALDEGPRLHLSRVGDAWCCYLDGLPICPERTGADGYAAAFATYQRTAWPLRIRVHEDTIPVWNGDAGAWGRSADLRPGAGGAR